MAPHSDRALRLAAVRELAETGRLRERRLRSRLSLAEVAEAVGTTAATVSRWERGLRKPRGEAAIRYLDLLEQLDQSEARNA